MPLTERDCIIIQARADAAFSRQQAWWSDWAEVGDYVLGSRIWRSWAQASVPGYYRPSDLVIDDTAQEALETLANGLHGMGTSRASRWAYLYPHDPMLRESRAAMRWVDDATEVIYSDLNNPASGFHSAIHMLYVDGGGIGTGILYSDDTQDVMSYHTRSIMECALSEGPNGRVDTLYRKFRMSAADCVLRWGERVLSDTELTAFREGKTLPDRTILHATLPRDVRNPEIVSRANLPWASIYMDAERRTLLEEGGYHEFPWHVFRWSVRTGDIYGVGPGLQHLPEIRMLNEMRRTLLVSSQKVADPVLDVPEDTYMGQLQTMPGGLLFRRRGRADDIIRPVQTGAQPDWAARLVEQQRNWIRHAFYNDAFDITSDSDGQNVKAAFTMQRREDRLRRLAGPFSRLDQDVLQPLIARTFAAKARRGQLPPLPPEMRGRPVRLLVDYLTPVARAQRANEADDTRQWLELVANVAAVDQTVWAEVDGHQLARYSASKWFSVPASIRRDPAEVEQLQAAHEQAQAVAAQQQVDANASEAIANTARARRDLAQAPTGEGLF